MSKKIAAAAGVACLLFVAQPAQASVSRSFVCPPDQSGFSPWDVTTVPYLADNAVDEKGNGDGVVCAKPGGVFILDDGTPFQLYNFIDNHVVVPG
jgi:hypothetical protein